MRKFIAFLLTATLMIGTIATYGASTTNGDYDGDVCTNPWGELFTTTAEPTTDEIETSSEPSDDTELVFNQVQGNDAADQTGIGNYDMWIAGTHLLEIAVDPEDGDHIQVRTVSNNNNWDTWSIQYKLAKYGLTPGAEYTMSIDVSATGTDFRLTLDGNNFANPNQSETAVTMDIPVTADADGKVSATIGAGLVGIGVTLDLSNIVIKDAEGNVVEYKDAPEVDPPTDPVDPPTDPVDPPTDPVDPPTDPVDPPTDPVDPPTDPVDPPTDPVDPPTDPVDPPTDPVDPPTDDTTTVVPPTDETTTVAPTTEAPTTKVKAPARTKVRYANKKKASRKIKLSIKRIKGARGYQVAVYKTLKNAKKNKKAIYKKHVRKATVRISIKNKYKNSKKLYIKVRAYKLNGKKKVYAKKWSKAKKVRVRKNKR